jgi:hypothetical protein
MAQKYRLPVEGKAHVFKLLRTRAQACPVIDCWIRTGRDCE